MRLEVDVDAIDSYQLFVTPSRVNMYSTTTVYKVNLYIAILMSMCSYCVSLILHVCSVYFVLQIEDLRDFVWRNVLLYFLNLSYD